MGSNSCYKSFTASDGEAHICILPNHHDEVNGDPTEEQKKHTCKCGLTSDGGSVEVKKKTKKAVK